MTPSDCSELRLLLGMLREGELSTDQSIRLEALLSTDAESRLFYVRYMHLCADLYSAFSRGDEREKSGVLPFELASQKDDPASESVAPSQPAPVLFSTFPHGSFGYLSSGWPVAYLIATLVVGLGIAIAAVTHVSQPDKRVVSQVADPNAESAHANLSPKASVVGQITGMVDCRWSVASGQENQKSEIGYLKSAVALGERLDIHTGLLEITYETGAKVILQGPATYEVESATGGYLAVGKLTARLEKENKKLPSRACGRAGGEGWFAEQQRSFYCFLVRRPHSHGCRDRSWHGVWCGGLARRATEGCGVSGRGASDDSQ